VLSPRPCSTIRGVDKFVSFLESEIQQKSRKSDIKILTHRAR
jgi:hypothetical protein